MGLTSLMLVVSIGMVLYCIGKANLRVVNIAKERWP